MTTPPIADQREPREIAKKIVCDILGYYTEHKLIDKITAAILQERLQVADLRTRLDEAVQLNSELNHNNTELKNRLAEAEARAEEHQGAAVGKFQITLNDEEKVDLEIFKNRYYKLQKDYLALEREKATQTANLQDRLAKSEERVKELESVAQYAMCTEHSKELKAGKRRYAHGGAARCQTCWNEIEDRLTKSERKRREAVSALEPFLEAIRLGEPYLHKEEVVLTVKECRDIVRVLKENEEAA